MKIGEALKLALEPWGLEVALDKPPHRRFDEWLETYFPEWPLIGEFTSFSFAGGDLRKGRSTFAFLSGNLGEPLFPSEDVDDSYRDVLEAGFIPIGGSIGGDPMVLNTRSADPLEVGFISHEDLWNPDVANGTEFYIKAPAPFPKYFSDLYEIEDYPSDFYSIVDTPRWREDSSPIVRAIEERRNRFLGKLDLLEKIRQNTPE